MLINNNLQSTLIIIMTVLGKVFLYDLVIYMIHIKKNLIVEIL